MKFLSKKKIYRVAVFILSISLWLLIWELSANSIGNEFILPQIGSTASALCALVSQYEFWYTVMLSITRILLGFILGTLLGVLLSVLGELVYPIGVFISIGMTIIKSTPVASIIMVLWVMLSDMDIPIIIALLMVMPIIYQNLIDGFKSIDKNLVEVSEIFQFSVWKKIKLLYFPALYKYFIPSLLTAIGLAWKSGIATEIITYTKNSIGKNIFDAKNIFEFPTVFAWTIVIVFISLVFEFSIKMFSRRIFKK